MEAELRGQCDKLIDRLLHAFDYMDSVDAGYARQVAREIASGLSDTIAAQAAELEGVRKDAARYRYLRKPWDERRADSIMVMFGRNLNKILDGPFLDAAIDTALADSDAGGGA